MSTKSTARNALATLALFAFTAFGSACEFTELGWQIPGNDDGAGMQLTAPDQVVPCDPPTPSNLK